MKKAVLENEVRFINYDRKLSRAEAKKIKAEWVAREQYSVDFHQEELNRTRRLPLPKTVATYREVLPGQRGYNKAGFGFNPRAYKGEWAFMVGSQIAEKLSI
jgi:hypothetical protein